MRVLLVGAGNIGSSLGPALAVAGCGTAEGACIDVVDPDIVSVANLSRGVCYEAADVGRPKALALAEHLVRLNPDVRVRGIVADVRWEFGTGLLRRYDLIFLATHDLASRLHVNRWVHRYAGRVRAIVNGAIGPLSAMAQIIVPGRTPCYACALDPEMTDDSAAMSCTGIASEGVSAAAATNGTTGMLAASMMALEGLRLVALGHSNLEGNEWVLRSDSPSAPFTAYRSAWRATCTDHRRASAEHVIEIAMDADATVESLRTAVAERLAVDASSVRLSSPLMITTHIRCACGDRRRFMRPQAAALRVTCERCGNSDPERFRAVTETELTSGPDHATLAEWGIPAGQALEAHVDRERYELVPDLSAVSIAEPPAPAA